MATSSTIQMNISSYMFVGQLLVEKNIFHMRLGFNIFPAKLAPGKSLIGLITVFGAILTGRQSGKKLLCLHGNQMANNFFQN